MKNLFLSPKGTSDFQKIFQSLNFILTEQRMQRADLAHIKRTLDYIIKIMNHKDTLDFFRNDDMSTSHQTELDEQ